jgi:hypothetical protein
MCMIVYASMYACHVICGLQFQCGHVHVYVDVYILYIIYIYVCECRCEHIIVNVNCTGSILCGILMQIGLREKPSPRAKFTCGMSHSGEPTRCFSASACLESWSKVRLYPYCGMVINPYIRIYITFVRIAINTVYIIYIYNFTCDYIIYVILYVIYDILYIIYIIIIYYVYIYIYVFIYIYIFIYYIIIYIYLIRVFVYICTSCRIPWWSSRGSGIPSHSFWVCQVTLEGSRAPDLHNLLEGVIGCPLKNNVDPLGFSWFILFITCYSML